MKIPTSELIGQRYGRLTLIEEIVPANTKGRQWKCQCSCGNIVISKLNNLKNGHTTSCGCFRKEATSKRLTKDLTGQIFGKLTVMNRVYGEGISNDAHSQWLCLCECGKTTVTSSRFLTSGHTKSCGCYRADNNTLFKCDERHPAWKGGVTSLKPGYKGTKEFRLWRKAVFQRDQRICQSCSATGGELHAHHLKSWAEYPELRFAIDNGLTLCEPCHMAWHKTQRSVLKLQVGGK
jgi:hypothetical protein